MDGRVKRLLTKTIKGIGPRKPVTEMMLSEIIRVLSSLQANQVTYAWSYNYDATAAGEHEITFEKKMPTEAFEIFAEGRSGKKKIDAHIIEDSETVSGFSVYVREACTIHYYIIRHR